jgi:hypothetical protein
MCSLIFVSYSLSNIVPYVVLIIPMCVPYLARSSTYFILFFMLKAFTFLDYLDLGWQFNNIIFQKISNYYQKKNWRNIIFLKGKLKKISWNIWECIVCWNGILKMKPPCLWALIWPSKPCFICSLNVPIKWEKVEILFLKGSSNEKHELWAKQSMCTKKQNPKLGVILPPEGQVRSEISLVPCFFSCVLFSSRLNISSLVSTKLGSSSDSLGYFTNESLSLSLSLRVFQNSGLTWHQFPIPIFQNFKSWGRSIQSTPFVMHL